MTKKRDHSLELLIDVDGLNFAQEGGYWIKYSLTLHDPHGERIFGIDNAHRPRKRSGPAAKSTRPKAADHLHRGGRVYAYEFRDAETLLADFDKGVNVALKRKGVKI
ncbi:MAG: DUF6516 family protein [Pseudomonadota bacterium]